MKTDLNKKIKEIIDNGNYFERDYYKTISQHQSEMNNNQYYYYISIDNNFHFLHKNGEIILPKKDFDFNILWDKLGDIPVDEDGDIEESFEQFEIGTNNEDIWHWFEEFFDISVGKEFFS